MSDSGLKLPASTELEGRVREALKVAREALRSLHTGSKGSSEKAIIGEVALDRLSSILEDGRS